MEQDSSTIHISDLNIVDIFHKIQLLYFAALCVLLFYKYCCSSTDCFTLDDLSYYMYKVIGFYSLTRMSIAYSKFKGKLNIIYMHFEFLKQVKTS